MDQSSRWAIISVRVGIARYHIEKIQGLVQDLQRDLERIRLRDVESRSVDSQQLGQRGPEARS
jgi:hypothetical protein